MPGADPPRAALRLHVPAAAAEARELLLPAGAARHVQVRRLQPGAPLVLFDGQGGEWDARVLRIGRREVTVEVGARRARPAGPARTVVLAVGMPANERMDWLVEKATELGAAAIQPLECVRSVLRFDAPRAERRRAHWEAIAAAACEQSGRSRLPGIEPVRPLAAWLDALPAGGPARRLLLSLAGDARPVAEVAGARGALLALAGPEGGLTDDEEAHARRRGFVPASLGPAVLRAETAPLALLAWAQVASAPGAGAAIGDTSA
jgi:16S rRNA (uracil1498-N3)-methyltransferase